MRRNYSAMAKKITPINLWLLRNSPDIVKKLANFSGQINPDSKRLGFGITLSVPENIEVYQPIKDYRLKQEILFAARKGEDLGRAYASLVEPRDGNEKYYGSLLILPWFNNKESSAIFDRFLRHGEPNAPLYGILPSRGEHPLASLASLIR